MAGKNLLTSVLLFLEDVTTFWKEAEFRNTYFFKDIFFGIPLPVHVIFTFDHHCVWSLFFFKPVCSVA